METFRNYLQQEFVKRTAKNPAYSLRSFAQQLKMNHATLSSLLSGKRKITPSTVLKLAKTLNLGPEEISRFTSVTGSEGAATSSYFIIQQDAFSAMSEWYFDAILELSIIPNFRLEPAIIAKSIGISGLQAKIALETLERLELLVKDKNGKFKIQHKNSTNILDSDFTSAANKKYQRSILEKSIEALDLVDRKKRDHTSTTMAISSKDVSKAKDLIQKFRNDLNSYLQRDSAKPDEVYQLQVSFFPLSVDSKEKGSL